MARKPHALTAVDHRQPHRVPALCGALGLCLAGIALAGAVVHGAPAIQPRWTWVPGDPATPIITESGRNILDNSSFEQGLGGWSAAGNEFCDRETDPSVAWHGSASCRVYNESAMPGDLLLGSPIFRAEAGQEYSLSCWARAAAPGVSLTLSLRNTALEEPITVRRELTAEWQRVETTGRLGPTRRNTYWVSIVVSGARKGVDAWVDAVQVERGPVSPYRPSADLELGAVTDRFANVYAWGEPVVIRPLVANWGALDRRCALTYSLRDYTGEEIRHGQVEIEAAHGRASSAEVPLGTDWRGFGEVILELRDPFADGTLRHRCSFATIPRRTEMTAAASPFFGVHGAGRFARNWDLLEAIGCQTAKVYYGWSNPGPGQPGDFSGIDATVQGLLRHHIVPIVCLGTWPPGWAEKKDAAGKPTGDLDVAAWEQYIAECVTHLKDVRLFESWNEVHYRGPTPNTVELMWRAHEICRRLRPDAVMMTNAISGVGTGDQFLQAFYRARDSHPLVATSIHYPWDSFRDSPERGHMRELLALTRQDGREIAHANPDLYITESGFHPGAELHAAGMAVMEGDGIEGLLCRQREKPEWMVQAFLIALGEGVKAHCEFDWCGYAIGPPWYSSLTLNDMSPMPALPAYAVMTHELRGARVVRELPIGRDPTRGLVVARGGETYTYLWSTRRDDLVAVRVRGSSLPVTDVMGRESAAPVRAGAAALHVGDGPIRVPGAVGQVIAPVTIVGQAQAPWIENRGSEVTVELANPFGEPWPVTARITMGPGGANAETGREVTIPPRARRSVKLTAVPTSAGLGVPFRAECRSAEGVFSDEGRSDVIGAESYAQAEREPVVTLEDFESGIGRWQKGAGEGARLTLSPKDGGMEIAIVHGPPQGTWASAVLPFAAPQKWSAYAGLTFRLKWTELPASQLQLHLIEEQGGTYYATFDAGTTAGRWRVVTVPFHDLKLGGWTQDPDGYLNLDRIVSLAIVGTSSTGSSTFCVDDLRLCRRLPASGAKG